MPLSLQYIAPALLPSPFCTVLIVFPILESFTCCCALIRVWSIVQIAWMRNLSMASMIQLARAPCLPALVICSAGIQRPFQMSHLAQMTATHARCAVIGRSNWRLFMCVLLCMCAAVHVCCLSAVSHHEYYSFASIFLTFLKENLSPEVFMLVWSKSMWKLDSLQSPIMNITALPANFLG